MFSNDHDKPRSFPPVGSMLLKVRLGDAQKFVRITEPNLTDFLDAGKENVDHGAHSINIF